MEKMRVLDLLEAGKINAEEAAQLLSVLNTTPRFMRKETRENVEEKFHQFAKDCNEFAKDVGAKMHDAYKDVEPKIKKASHKALVKAADALEKAANSISESLKKDELDLDDDAPKEN
ncbi:MAG: hypothetical protein LBI27_03475 [Clostridiales bacterium]|jgi:predicted transcriptional regulator|nr:hypothetical protein [Clostridiales bacterium]